MEIKLNLIDEYDVIVLHNLLNNEKMRCVKDNCSHKDMMDLLEGNNDNEKAKGRLEHEKHCTRLNNEKIKVIDNLINQLNLIEV